jgi:4'-phosphopantetheinyl transferase
VRADGPIANGVHIWAFGLDLALGRLEVLQGWLSSDERLRAARLRFSRERDRFVAARGQLREILARYLQTTPDAVDFAYGPQGKPRLAGHDALRFNVSHSEGQALLAVARGQEVGIDLERIRPDVDCERIAIDFFSAAEGAALMAMPVAARPGAFFACWTRKEAFIKAMGGGLAVPLADFDVSLDPDGPARLLRTAWDPQETARWSLRELEGPPGFAAAIAVQGGPPRLHAVSVSPVRPHHQ